MRRLRLGDVVEPKRRLGSSTRAMAAGTSRRATTEGVADAPVPTAQTAELTVHGSLDGTLSLHWVGSLAWTRPVAPIGLEWRACRRDPHAVDRPMTGEATGAAHALRLDMPSDHPPWSATLNQGSGSEGQTVGGSAAHPVQNQASTGARDGLLPQAAEILILRRMFGWRTHGLRGSTDPPGKISTAFWSRRLRSTRLSSFRPTSGRASSPNATWPASHSLPRKSTWSPELRSPGWRAVAPLFKR